MWRNTGASSTRKSTAYGTVENDTLLAVAYKAIYLDDALVGVVGMEFLFDKLADKMKQLGCLPDVSVFIDDEKINEKMIMFRRIMFDAIYSTNTATYFSPVKRTLSTVLF